ncbi:MAG: DUF58 domain-containing protein [Defluviitaleaceae bacterium]|nr:DUF58 domain-containing protein [Defluviitaleaceae bacterium]
MTKSFVFLVALGAPVTFAAWLLDGSYIAMFIFWNLFLLGLLVLDILITPKKKTLQVRRDDEDVLYFKDENEIVFYVKNTSNFALYVQGKDESMRHFSVLSEEEPDNWLAPREEELFSYTVMPTKRGSFMFRHIYLRYTGVLGLCTKHVRVECPREYKVYPNVRDLGKYRLMLQKKRLMTGDRAAKDYGIGYEFESLRPYVVGDDYRKINWRATAREHKIIVNQYQVERNQPVYILLDIGRPMSYCVKGYKKLDYAINAALILSDIVNQAGEKVGLMVYDSMVRSHIAPGQGAGHRNLLMETLYHVEDNRSTADVGGAFRVLCEKQKRRSLVFIFTDFELPEEARELVAHIALLKKRHMPIVIFMENESLNSLAEKPIRKGRKFDKVVQTTAVEFRDERRDIFRSLAAMGVPTVESKAEDFALAAVNRYISLA